MVMVAGLNCKSRIDTWPAPGSTVGVGGTGVLVAVGCTPGTDVEVGATGAGVAVGAAGTGVEVADGRGTFVAVGAAVAPVPGGAEVAPPEVVGVDDADS